MFVAILIQRNTKILVRAKTNYFQNRQKMGTLPNKKYPQVVTRQEVAFLVLGYLREEKFKQTLEIFEKEAKNVIKNMKLVSIINKTIIMNFQAIFT